MSADVRSKTAAAISNAGDRALVGYLPVGYPDVETAIEAAVAVADAGFAVLELGIPYSDPAMDGPVIQAATQQVLNRGFSTTEVFEIVEGVTARTDAAVLTMTYWNPVLRYGVERFARDFAAAGGAGLITPDLTPENADDWIRASDAHDLDRIFLAAPSSSDARIDSAVSASRGFVYTVSTMGTTGVRGDMDTAARQLSERIGESSQRLGKPIARCVGLGISRPEHVTDVLGYAEGAIVGSALVAALRDGGVPALAAKAAELATGLHTNSQTLS